MKGGGILVRFEKTDPGGGLFREKTFYFPNCTESSFGLRPVVPLGTPEGRGRSLSGPWGPAVGSLIFLNPLRRIR